MIFFILRPASLESELQREGCYTLLKILARGALCAAVSINMFLEVLRTCTMKPDSATSHTLTQTVHQGMKIVFIFEPQCTVNPRTDRQL